MFSETLRSRWFSGCIHVALWLLLFLVATGIGGKQPYYREALPDPAAVVAPVPVARLENLFAPSSPMASPTDAGGRNPFETTYFIPQTTPPPPAPTTRKISLTYQGYYQTGDGPQRALIRFGDALASVPLGGTVATNLFVAQVTTLNLTLTNTAAQTNVLTLNTRREIEIPLR